MCPLIRRPFLFRYLSACAALFGACQPYGGLLPDSHDSGGSTGEEEPVERIGSAEDDDSGMPTSTLPGAEGVAVASQLWDESAVPEFAIELSEASMEALRRAPTTYAEGRFIYQDQVFEPVGVRTKGSSTWQSIDDKPSLKIKFDEYDEDMEFIELTELTFNNMVSDYSMMHERVAYLVFREAGVPSCRAHHAHITLNGEDYGLYVNVESATRKLMIPWFEDIQGTMWEFWGADFESAYISGFENKFGKDERLILYETAAALEGNGPIDMEAVDSTLDMATYLSYWAVCAVVGQYDGYPYRYPSDDAYIYHDPESDQLKFMPHGVDESFYYPDWNPADDVISRVGWKCLASPECTEAWKTRIDEVLDIVDGLDALAYVDEVQAQIQPYVLSDPKRPYTPAQVTDYQASMRHMIEYRRTQLEALLGP